MVDFRLMKQEKPRISIVAGLGRDKQHNRVIGKDNRLLWHIPDDLKRFKDLTLGHPVVMGRKTFESIVAVLGTPLPGRTNIVVTRDASWSYPGVEIRHSLEAALELARSLDSEEIFIGGGTELYVQALPHVDRLYLTLIDDEKEGDTFFPDYDDFKEEISREERRWNELRYMWLTLDR
jgi:dihydrofolate reductase